MSRNGKAALADIVSSVTVGLCFLAAAHVRPLGWSLAAIITAYAILGLLFVQRYPRQELLRQALNAVGKLPAGTKVEVESK